jgi:hypothetical protein
MFYELRWGHWGAGVLGHWGNAALGYWGTAALRRLNSSAKQPKLGPNSIARSQQHFDEDGEDDENEDDDDE